MKAICKLCLQEKELIGKSHIIPDFMYQGIRQKNGKVVEVNLNNLANAKFHSSTIYDKHILCKDCDNRIIGGLESYASRVFYGTAKLQIESEEQEFNNELQNIFLKGVDYTKFKLFLLSILWRSSLSKQRLFSDINLGSACEEELRKMIFEGNAGDPLTFPVCVFVTEENKRLPVKTVLQPRQNELDGNVTCLFFINGMYLWFNVTPEGMAEVFKRELISPNGDVTIAILKGKTAEGFIDSFAGKKIRFSKNLA